MVGVIWVSSIVGFLAMLGLLLNYALIKIQVNADLEGLDGQLKATIYLWRLKVFHMSLPNIKVDEEPLEVTIESKTNASDEKEKTFDKIQLMDMYDTVKDLVSIMKKGKVTKIYQFRDFNWETTIGTGQADQTAIIYGVCWTFKSILIRGMQAFFVIENPSYVVHPIFNQGYFETHFSCMISFRLGKAIRQALWIRKQLKRRRLLHGGTSYSRTHEDSA